MAHYSSDQLHYEDGDKRPLKSISVKCLVFASYAQFGVNAGFEELMGDRNGIRYRPIRSLRPATVD